jgi:hypothetical protein
MSPETQPTAVISPGAAGIGGSSGVTGGSSGVVGGSSGTGSGLGSLCFVPFLASLSLAFADVTGVAPRASELVTSASGSAIATDLGASVAALAAGAAEGDFDTAESALTPLASDHAPTATTDAHATMTRMPGTLGPRFMKTPAMRVALLHARAPTLSVLSADYTQQALVCIEPLAARATHRMIVRFVGSHLS